MFSIIFLDRYYGILKLIKQCRLSQSRIYKVGFPQRHPKLTSLLVHSYFEVHVKADLQHYKSNAGFKKVTDMLTF